MNTGNRDGDPAPLTGVAAGGPRQRQFLETFGFFAAPRSRCGDPSRYAQAAFGGNSTSGRIVYLPIYLRAIPYLRRGVAVSLWGYCRFSRRCSRTGLFRPGSPRRAGRGDDPRVEERRLVESSAMLPSRSG